MPLNDAAFRQLSPEEQAKARRVMLSIDGEGYVRRRWQHFIAGWFGQRKPSESALRDGGFRLHVREMVADIFGCSRDDVDAHITYMHAASIDELDLTLHIERPVVMSVRATII